LSTNFTYRARDGNGLVITGNIAAENQGAVASFVRGKGYFVTQITVDKQPLTFHSLLKNWHKISAKELALFCRQFSTMVDAGLSLVASLHILIDQAQSKKMKEALEALYKDVQEGETLSQAMLQHNTIFPPVMTAMIEAGEVGGVLDQILERLSVQFEKEYKLDEKVKSAMVYPAVVMGMACLSVTFILTFVLPTFMKMFEDMHMDLPILTRALLAVSGFLRNDGIFLLLGWFVCAIIVKTLLGKPEFRLAFDSLIMKAPVFGLLWRKIAIARFARTLSTLIKGGVPLITALEVVKKTVNNASMMQALGEAQDGIREGAGLSVPLAASQVFTPMVVQMIAVGEETGALDKMLEKVADFYDSDVEDMVARLSTLLEPLLIGFMGVVIGIIVLAIMIPMFDVVTGMGKV
jgi:type IV pilus assembly protein PilC